ncbi:MAG: ATP-binding cassette domain-containing protein [Chloroflexi bacterium]|nr:ATP-binding cassette domain-containing protein [Chloroflexota bacterium]
MTDEIVVTRGLTRGYRMGESTVLALRGVDLHLLRGEFVAVAGVSGSGKSTLLHLIGGLDRPTSGEVWVDGVDLGSATEAERTRHRRERVGFVFQSFHLLPRLTALENAALPLMFAGVPREERNARARAILEEVGLGHRLHHYPSQLSGGEQQRVAIARALVHNPSLILADEPTGNLDSQTGAEILALLRRLNEEHGVTVLMVTHDPAAAAATDRTIHLRDGSIERTKDEGGRMKNRERQASSFTHTPHPSSSLRFSDLWRSAFSNLERRAVRSGLTVLGVFVGIVTIVTMLSIAVGVELEVERNVEGVGLETVFVSPPQAQTSATDPFADPLPTTPITSASIDTLRRMPQVASVAPLVDLPAYLDLRVELGSRTASATVESSAQRISPFQGDTPFVAGRALTPGEARGVVLTSRLATELGVGDVQKLVGQKVTLVVRLPRGETNQFPVTVIGVQRDNRTSIQLGVQDAADIKEWWYGQPNLFETRGYDGLVVKATSLATVGAVVDQVRALGLQARSLQSFLDVANRIFATLNALLGSIGGLALLVAALGVMNTMIMAVYERTREIGMLKAIGASRGEVLGLFVAEAGMIGFIGGLLGLVLGTLIGRGVDWAGHWYLASQGVLGVGPLSVVPLWLAVGSIAFGTLVGLAAGVYPAMRAARLDPVVALRHE